MRKSRRIVRRYRKLVRLFGDLNKQIRILIRRI